MKNLFLGDIMGKAGRRALHDFLPKLLEDLSPDIVIANGENAAHGNGITKKFCEEFYALGIHCITTGNHVWDQREVIKYIEKDERLLRPINFPQGTVGQGIWESELEDGRKIAVINIMGRLFMEPLDDPFAVIERALEGKVLGNNYDAIFIDFHGEATSEKMAFAQYLDGRVSAVVGTHTHIPTADSQIFPEGTAFQADAGMCGDYDSVIGVKKHTSINRFTKKMPGEKMEPAEGQGTLCGVFVVTDDQTGKAIRIDPVRLGARLSQTQPV